MSAYFFHLLVSVQEGNASWLHVDTRLCRGTKNEKYDFVIGPVLTTERQKELILEEAGEKLSSDMRRLITSKTSLSIFRPVVDGKLVLEFKTFSKGFTQQQHSVHFTEAVKDIEKLKAIAQGCPQGRGIVLFDGDGYLTENRRSVLREKRMPDDILRIYVCENPARAARPWVAL